MASSHRDEISRLELLHAAHPDGLVFPHLADAYRRAGRYSQAESLLKAGLRRHSDYSSAHVVMGRLRLDQGKRDEARSAFERVLQIDPDNQVALEYLGDLAREQGRTEDALGFLRRLRRLKSDDDLAREIEELERQVSHPGGANGAGSRTEPVAAVERNGVAARSGANPTSSHRPSPPPDSAAGHPPADDPPPPPRGMEPGEVVTETMAELYARQGLHERAAAVYRQLLERRPGDTRLRAKLDQVTAAAPATSAAPPVAPAAAAVETEPVTERLRESPEEPSIAASLRSVLAWRGGAGDARPEAPAPSLTGSPAPAEQDPAPAEQEWTPFAEEPNAVGSARVTAPSPPAPVPPASADAAPQPAAQPRSRPASQQPPAPPAPRRPTAQAVPQAAHPAPWQAVLPVTQALPSDNPQAKALIAITDLLVGLLEYRDPFFRGSSSLTRLLADSVAVEMGLSAEQRVDLALAAVLRDLGRLALGGKLLPGTKLQPTHEARRRIERHVDLALHLLEGMDLPREVRLAVRHHHERWDGAGYPDALAGESIPALARILAVADSFAAMVSPRPYRLPRKVHEAARELQEEAGTHYDPAVVEALLRVVGRREQANFGFVQRHHILLVNPDQPGAVVTAAKLCSAGYLAEVSAEPATARERLRRVPVAALVVSAEMGDDAAAAFIRELRSDPLFNALPIVVVEAESVTLRVRLLESGADVCFPPEVTYAELQGTLGALVRRTLRTKRAPGPAATEGEAPWLALQGDVQDFPLTWLLQVMKYDSRTAAIGIRTGSEEGAIYLRQGDAVHAQIRNGAKGETALREMLKWRKGRFTVQPEARPREQTIRTSIMHLLLTQAVDEDHAAAGIFGAVSEGG